MKEATAPPRVARLLGLATGERAVRRAAPRARGGVPRSRLVQRQLDLCSPHPWGCSLAVHAADPGAHLLPAHATFRGSTEAPVWAQVDARVFLRDGSGYSRAQAAFRMAYQLPNVSAVAVGTDEPAHLGELVGALAATPDEQAVADYRTLLRDRPRTQSV